MKNIKLFVTFVASLFFLFSCEKEKLKLVDLTRSDSQSLS